MRTAKSGLAEQDSQYAERFRWLLRMYPKANGEMWRGADLERASGGIISAAYASALRKGKIKSPGFTQLYEIARIMGFDPQLWSAGSGELQDSQDSPQSGPAAGSSYQALVEELFRENPDPRTGEPYGEQEVAAASGGVLGEEEVRRIRGGEDESPSMLQLLAISGFFGVRPGYWDRVSEVPVVDDELRELLEAYAVDDSDRRLATLHRTRGLPAQAKSDILDLIIDQLEGRAGQGGSAGTDEEGEVGSKEGGREG